MGHQCLAGGVIVDIAFSSTMSFSSLVLCCPNKGISLSRQGLVVSFILVWTGLTAMSPWLAKLCHFPPGDKHNPLSSCILSVESVRETYPLDSRSGTLSVSWFWSSRMAGSDWTLDSLSGESWFHPQETFSRACTPTERFLSWFFFLIINLFWFIFLHFRVVLKALLIEM